MTDEWGLVDADGESRSSLVQFALVGTSTQPILIRNNIGSSRASADNDFSLGGQSDVVATQDTSLNDWILGDFTGLGLASIVHLEPACNPDLTAFQIFCNAGSEQLDPRGDGTWKISQAVPVPPNGLPDGHWIAMDTNGDGKVDLLHIAPRDPDDQLHVDSGLRLDVFRSGPGDVTAPDHQIVLAALDSSPWFAVDPDGAGVESLGRISADAEGRYLVDLRVSPNVADRLTHIDNGIGGTADFGYGPSRSWRTDVSKNCGLPADVGLMSVTSLTLSPGGSTTPASGSQSPTETFQYNCAQWSGSTHNWLGWRETISTTPRSPATSARSVDRKHYLSPTCGDLVTSQTMSSDGVLVELDSSTFPEPASSADPCKAIQSEQRQCGPQYPCASSIHAFSYDTYGNVIQDHQQAKIGNGSVTVERTTSRTYVPPGPRNIVNLLAGLTLSSPRPGGSAIISRQRFCYDHNCERTTADAPGLLTDSILVDPADSTVTRRTTYDYDRFGNQIGITDPLGERTATEYDEQAHIYPVATTDALGQVTIRHWDPGLGVLQSVTDANGLTTSYQHDSLGRSTGSTSPTGVSSHTSYANFGDPKSEQVQSSTQDGSPEGLLTTTRFDGLGRTVAVTRKGDNAGRDDTTQSVYADTNANVYKQTHWSDGTVTSPPAETYSYDALGRLAGQIHADGTHTNHEYKSTATGIEDIFTDESGHVTTTSYDAWGRPITVAQPGPGSPTTDMSATLNYEYDAADQLTGIVDPAGHRTTKVWDGFGEKVSEQDADRGTTTATYDAAGNLRSSTDARGVTTTFEYDALRRLTRRVTRGASETTWRYDERGHGASVGRLTSVSDPSAQGCRKQIGTDQTYDQLGRPYRTTYCVAGHSATFTTSYDTNGRQSAVVYPDGERVSLQYGRSGRLETFGTYATGATYSPSGQLVGLTLGNGLHEQWSYDENRGWGIGSRSVMRGSTVVGDDVARAPNGDVTTENTMPNDATQTFNYDAGDRLTAVLGTSNNVITYDAAGSITSSSSTGTYNYNSSHCAKQASPPPHGVTDIVSADQGYTTLCYDANGNRTKVDGPGNRHQTLTWSPDDRVARIVTQRSSTSSRKKSRVVNDVTLTYGAEGQLVRQQVADPLDIEYLGQLAQWQSDSGLMKNYYFGGQLIAQKNKKDTYYYQNDRRGSPQVVMGSHGSILARISYDAWGNTAVAGHVPPGSPGFAGSIPIQGTEYAQMGARLYDSQHGIFAMADPVSPSSGGTQGANRFAYANNNPESVVDPSGYAGVEDYFGDASGGGSTGIPGLPDGIPGLNNINAYGVWGVVFSVPGILDYTASPWSYSEYDFAAQEYETPYGPFDEYGTLTSGGAATGSEGSPVGLTSSDSRVLELARGVSSYVGYNVPGYVNPGPRPETDLDRIAEPYVRLMLFLLGEPIGPMASEGPMWNVNELVNRPRVGSALKVDAPGNQGLGFENLNRPAVREFGASPLSHGFEDMVDNYVNDAEVFDLGDNAYLYQLEGTNNGVDGRFEWIVQDGELTHRMFVRGGSINGRPIIP